MIPENDLDGILDFTWAELAQAAVAPDSGLRHAQLATKGTHGWPQLRSVILRHADAAARQVGFHTDNRSAKFAELDAETAVALVAYDRARGLQLRLLGQAELHVGDAKAREAWGGLPPPGRVPYRSPLGPGRPLDDPAEGDPTPAARHPADEAEGFENFAFVVVRLVRIDWLHLRPTGHRRARFDWNGAWEGGWLTP